MRALDVEEKTGHHTVRWQPLMRVIEASTGVSKRSLANSLHRLEERRLVVVARPGQDQAPEGRFVASFELTEAGREQARELNMNQGRTRASVEREQRSREPLAPLRSRWSKERERVEALVLADQGLIDDLERLYGEEPKLGGGTPTEEAAKRFLLVARTRFIQDFVLHELPAALAILEEPTPADQHLVGVEMVWRGDRPFDPNAPLTKQQLDLIAALLKPRSLAPDD